MGRQVNPNVPEDGYKSKKEFEDKGNIADADLTVFNIADSSKKIAFDASGQSTGKKVTVAAGANTSDATFTLPTSSGTLAKLTDIVSGVYFAVLTDSKTQNTGGGQFDSGSWKTRTLNTKDYDGIGITLSSNQFTLPSGTYIIHAICPGYQIQSHQAKLYDITNSADAMMGSSEFTGASNVSNKSIILAKVTPSVSTTYELRHQCSNTSTLGFGAPANFGTEVYSQVTVVKIA